jgi:hypothetical protein
MQTEFVVCPFVDEETNGSYLFANGLNRANGLAHLWSVVNSVQDFFIYVFRF